MNEYHKLIAAIVAIAVLFAGYIGFSGSGNTFPIPSPTPYVQALPPLGPDFVIDRTTEAGGGGFNSVGTSLYARASNSFYPGVNGWDGRVIAGAYGVIQQVKLQNIGSQNVTINVTGSSGTTFLPGGLITLSPGQTYDNISVSVTNFGDLTINATNNFTGGANFPLSNLKASFLFNEGAGSTTVDSAGGGNVPTFYGTYTPVYTTFSPRVARGAVAFTPGYINMTPNTFNVTNVVAFSLCMWLNNSKNVDYNTTDVWLAGANITVTTFAVTLQNYTIVNNTNITLLNVSELGISVASVAIQNATGALLPAGNYSVYADGHIFFNNTDISINWTGSTNKTGFGPLVRINYTYFNWTGLPTSVAAATSNFSISVAGGHNVTFGNQTLTWSMKTNASTLANVTLDLINGTFYNYMNDSKWHHYCFLTNATTMYIVLDGSTKSTSSLSGQMNNYTTTKWYFGLGWQNKTGTPQYHAYPRAYDSTYYFNTFLSTAQVSYLYTNESNQPTVLSTVVVKRG